MNRMKCESRDAKVAVGTQNFRTPQLLNFLRDFDKISMLH